MPTAIEPTLDIKFARRKMRATFETHRSTTRKIRLRPRHRAHRPMPFFPAASMSDQRSRISFLQSFRPAFDSHFPHKLLQRISSSHRPRRRNVRLENARSDSGFDARMCTSTMPPDRGAEAARRRPHGSNRSMRGKAFPIECPVRRTCRDKLHDRRRRCGAGGLGRWSRRSRTRGDRAARNEEMPQLVHAAGVA